MKKLITNITATISVAVSLSCSAQSFHWAKSISENSFASTTGGTSICTDSLGNTYVTGITSDPAFPATASAYQKVRGGSVDAFIIKYNSFGTLLWATYYGGSDYDCATGIALDKSGDVVVTGYTSSSNFPTSAGAYKTKKGGTYDPFILKFNANGNRLWATYFGGAKDDFSNGIATDAKGNIFIIGHEISSPSTSVSDAFVAKLNSSGLLLWNINLRGNGTDVGKAIATDATGNVFITGQTSSTDFTMCPPNVNPGTTFCTLGLNGGYDAFIMKLNNTNGALQWGRYLGGNADDAGTCIATDPLGNVYLAGKTSSTNFPTLKSSGYYQGSLAGNSDIFISKYSNTGDVLWSTYYGGSNVDEPTAIAIDKTFRQVYVTGSTGSTNFPTYKGGAAFFIGSHSSSFANSGFIFRFDSQNNRTWSTYVGPKSSVNAVVANGYYAYITGSYRDLLKLESTTMTALSGAVAGFTAKIGPNPLAVAISSIKHVRCNSEKTGSASVIPSGGVPFYKYSWSNGATTSVVSNLAAGSYTVTVTDKVGTSVRKTVSILQPAAISIATTINGSSVTAVVSGGTPAYYYTWSNGASQPIVNNLTVGIHTLTVYDQNGCKATKSVSILQPSKKMEDNVSSLSNELTDVVVVEVKAYPNPFSNSLTIEVGEEYEELQITLIDMLGKTVIRQFSSQHDSKVNLDVSELSPGIYTAEVVAGTAKPSYLKVVKE